MKAKLIKKSFIYIIFLMIIIGIGIFLYFKQNCKSEGSQKTIEKNCPNYMCKIPAGDFMMGCDEKLDSKCKHADPFHKVYLDTFTIDQYEVTVKEFKKCVDAKRCSRENFTIGTDVLYNYGVCGRENHPMSGVNLYGAKEYCKFVNKQIPTEAQWEKAARGTDGRIYPWGNNKANCNYAIYNEKTEGCGKLSTWNIGSKSMGKSPYGVYDMAGNLFEWTDDTYSRTYKNLSYKNPHNNKGIFYILKGGAWSYNSSFLRTYKKTVIDRAFSKGATYGFRCVK